MGLSKASQCEESITEQLAVREISKGRFLFSEVIQGQMDLKILFSSFQPMHDPRFQGIYQPFTHLPGKLNTNPYRMGGEIDDPILERKVNRHRQHVRTT